MNQHIMIFYGLTRLINLRLLSKVIPRNRRLVPGILDTRDLEKITFRL